MDRNAVLLKKLDLSGRGLEIGPSHSPIVKKSSGCKVQTLDHLDREGLIDKYTGHGVDVESIEEVDFVWKGERYCDLIGETHCFDWVLASHVIEHTPDLIGFLVDCESILKKSGWLSLAIPDKRNCFDRFRPISGLADVLDSHFEKRTRHSAGAVAEFYMNVISQGGRISWEQGFSGEVEFIHTPEEALENMEKALSRKDEFDIHAWCFVPSSFRLLLFDLYRLGMTKLRETSFLASGGGEFYLTLGTEGEGPSCSRESLLLAVERELSEL